MYVNSTGRCHMASSGTSSPVAFRAFKGIHRHTYIQNKISIETILARARPRNAQNPFNREDTFRKKF